MANLNDTEPMTHKFMLTMLLQCVFFSLFQAKEDQLIGASQSLRQRLSPSAHVSIARVLATKSDLLNVKKTSSGRERAAAQCEVNKVLIGKVDNIIRSIFTCTFLQDSSVFSDPLGNCAMLTYSVYVCVCGVYRFQTEEGGHRRRDLLQRCHLSNSVLRPHGTSVREEEGGVGEVAESKEVSYKLKLWPCNYTFSVLQGGQEVEEKGRGKVVEKEEGGIVNTAEGEGEKGEGGTDNTVVASNNTTTLNKEMTSRYKSTVIIIIFVKNYM